jgi:HPr kinase/phosphorylase
VTGARTDLHASCVACDGRGLLILGAPGAGKSRLALELVALGAALVADDRVRLRRDGERLAASAPPRLAGLVEARGVGLLRLPFAPSATLAVAVDLDRAETERLPPRRSTAFLGATIPLILAGPSAAALIAALRHGPPLDPEAALPEG